MKSFGEKVAGKTWIFINGKTFSVEAESSTAKRSKNNQQQDSKEISAPMPGKITAVKVKAGDQIKTDQPVIVMEAMKMEYTLKAARDGTVEEVRAVVGEQVNLGALLVRFK